jgi:UDP-N-acetylglucosamine 2-epimerase (non-hydrolysing)
MKKILLIAGARPNFMKIAPLIHELQKTNFSWKLVHTGQHYDAKLSDIFFTELNIPKPDYNLEVGSGSHAIQTAKIMEKFEPICIKEKPDLVIVVGDVNSTIACALVAKKLNIKVAHVEAGLRSFDNNMPEEINRKLTDCISDYLFVSEESGLRNLKNEGIDKEKIFFVGNIMIDSLFNNLEKINKSDASKVYNEKYCILTLHRPSNVDNKDELKLLLFELIKISKLIKIIWPIHPRTKKNLLDLGLDNIINESNIILKDPIGYIDFLNLVKNSTFVLTDSGGLQEETTYLNIPCLTLRENTERPSTIDIGTNTLLNKNEIIGNINLILAGKYKKGSIPQLWDGKTAERIIKILRDKYEN